MSLQYHYRRTRLFSAALTAGLALAGMSHAALGQIETLVEDYEFATSDEAAEAGVTDLTDAANRPTFYIDGECDPLPPPCDAVSEGFFSLGTDAAFCQQWCDAGSRIGFRRWVDQARFPSVCQNGHHYAPLQHSYGDPNYPGTGIPDYLLSELQVICDAYGDGSYADGPTGTHFWVNLVDCEGEVFEFINHSEAALYSELWTYDLPMGQTFLRLSSQSIVDGQPIGDGLLTEIAATETFIQDDDDPPTTFGKWYIDNLRVREPAGTQPVPTVSQWGLVIMVLLLLSAATAVFRTRKVPCLK